MPRVDDLEVRETDTFLFERTSGFKSWLGLSFWVRLPAAAHNQYKTTILKQNQEVNKNGFKQRICGRFVLPADEGSYNKKRKAAEKL
jgi:hypothetical protein